MGVGGACGNAELQMAIGGDRGAVVAVGELHGEVFDM